jgi:hypothetical protein
MLTSTQSYVVYQGNGATTVFPFNFYVPAAGDLVVTITNTATGVSTVLASTQYAVTGIGNATGGSVTYGTGNPLAAGNTIAIQRIVPLQQNTSLSNQGALYPAVVEAALDYLTMAVQQLSAGLTSTTPVLPVFNSAPQTLAVNSAAPSIASLAPVYVTANTQATTIAAFTGLTPGYVFAILFEDANTTIAFGTGIKGNNSQNWTPQYGDCMICVSDGTFVTGNPSEVWSAIQNYVQGYVQSYVAAQIAATATPAYRNRFLNPEKRIDGRNNGAAQTITTSGGNQYTVDRWFATASGANITGQQVSGAGQFENCYQITGAAGNTGFTLGQRIKASNILDLTGGTVTLSDYLASSSLTSLTWTAYYAGSTDTWTSPVQIATGTWNLTSTMTQYSASFTLPANAVNGVQVIYSGGALLAGQTFSTGGSQLEAGSVATAFEHRPDAIERFRCQEYLPIWRDLSAAGELIAAGIATSATSATFIFTPPTPARVAPTGVTTSTIGDFSVVSAAGSSYTASAVSLSSLSTGAVAMAINVTCATGLTTGQGVWLKGGNGDYIYFTGCEL